MSEALLYGLGGAVVVLGLLIVVAVKIVNEYERGVIFRLGRVTGAKGPGLFFIIPIIDRMVKVNLQTVTADIPRQDVITKDNVTLRVNAVTYFNVVDPVRATVVVQNYLVATSQIAQTTLRSILGQVELDELLINRDKINAELQQIIDGVTDPWGVKVTLVEVKDVELPETMRRATGRQAEAERERRSKVIHAEGEREAAASLGEAATTLAASPGAMQLRLLSTMTEVAAERNSTLIFPVPVELLRFAEHMSPANQPPGPPDPTRRRGSSHRRRPSRRRHRSRAIRRTRRIRPSCDVPAPATRVDVCGAQRIYSSWTGFDTAGPPHFDGTRILAGWVPETGGPGHPPLDCGASRREPLGARAATGGVLGS